MKYEHLLLEQDEHVAIVTLNRPERLNALNNILWNEVIEIGEHLRSDDSIRAVVFTGAGRGFCSGADVDPGPPRNPNEEGPRREDLLDEYGQIGRQALSIYRTLDKPTVAAVNGVAVGSGYALALACDLRVGSEFTRFKTMFLERNVSPDSGMSYFLPKIVGYSRAMDLIYTSRFVGSEEAYRIGLLDRLFEADTLVANAVQLAKEMSAWPPVATQVAKRVMQHGVNASLEEQLRFEVLGVNLSGRAVNDQKEAYDFFLEKRSPNFTGT